MWFLPLTETGEIKGNKGAPCALLYCSTPGGVPGKEYLLYSYLLIEWVTYSAFYLGHIKDKSNFKVSVHCQWWPWWGPGDLSRQCSCFKIILMTFLVTNTRPRQSTLGMFTQRKTWLFCKIRVVTAFSFPLWKIITLWLWGAGNVGKEWKTHAEGGETPVSY